MAFRFAVGRLYSLVPKPQAPLVKESQKLKVKSKNPINKFRVTLVLGGSLRVRKRVPRWGL